MKRNPRCEKGFTLVEIMVVLAIISILMSLTTPSLKSFSENRKLTAAGDSLRSLCLFARDVAMTEGENYIIVFDLDNQKYWLAKASALEFGDLSQTIGIGAFGPQTESTTAESTTTSGQSTSAQAATNARVGGVLGKARPMIEAITLARVDVDRGGIVTSQTTGYEYIEFSAEDTAEPASIYLTNVEGRAIVVDVPEKPARTRVRRLTDDEIAAAGLETGRQP